MSQCPDRNLVDAGLGDSADGLEVHPAAGLKQDRTSAADSHGFAQLIVRHVVEKDDRNSIEAAEHAHLVEGIRLDFDDDAGLAPVRLVDGALESGGIAGHGKVVVLGQNAVEQSEAVVCPASGADRDAFEFAKSGSRLARVEDDGFRAGHGIDEAAGQRGYPAEALEEVEGGAFGGEQCTGRAGDGEDDVARRDGIAVVFQDFDFECGINQAEDFAGRVGAGENRIFFGDDAGVRAVIGRDKALGRDVAGAEVLGERTTDGFKR